MKSRLASALQMSRQTIDNYQGTVKHFGLDGLIKGYNPSDSKSLRKQRERHAQHNKRIPGNRARQLEQIRREKRQAREEQKHEQSVFKFGYEDSAILVEAEDQPFSEQHDWEPSRYAGVATYLIPLITEWKWLQLVMGYFGSAFKIFMVFVLMAARNIRSIENLKNVRHREAGIVLGLRQLASKPKLWRFGNGFTMYLIKGVLFHFLRIIFVIRLAQGLLDCNFGLATGIYCPACWIAILV
jgi:hypothetical protein